MDTITPEIIRKIRDSRNETQKEFGRLFKVDRLTIKNWEKNQTSPNRTNLGVLEDLIEEQSVYSEENYTDDEIITKIQGFLITLPFSEKLVVLNDISLRAQKSANTIFRNRGRKKIIK